MTRSPRRFSAQEAIAGGDPYPEYAWFRAHDPVHLGEPGWPLGQPQVVLFRYQDVATWLRDPRVIRDFTVFPEIRAMRKLQRWKPPAPTTFAAVSRQYMLFKDPPDHTRLRTIANRAFTARFVAGRRAAIEAGASSLVRVFREEQGGAGDLIQAVAYPLPMLVAADVLGIPPEDSHRFRAWSSVVGATVDTPTEALGDAERRLNAATGELCDYLRSLVARRRREPADDFVSRLIAERDDDGHGLDEDELVAMCLLMITAGHETMANVIANGVYALMRHRDQWELLVADPARAGNAVDEILRYDSPIQFTSRLAGEELEIDGVRVPRGSEMLFMLGSANRDAAVWDAPDTLRIDRAVGRHLAFGMGAHVCMGVPLARMEAQIVFATLAREAPHMVLSGDAPRWRPVLHGLARLDVQLAP